MMNKIIITCISRDNLHIDSYFILNDSLLVDDILCNIK